MALDKLILMMECFQSKHLQAGMWDISISFLLSALLKLRNSFDDNLLRSMTSGWGAPNQKNRFIIQVCYLHSYCFNQRKQKRTDWGMWKSRHTTDEVLPLMRLAGTIISRLSFLLVPAPSFFDTFDFFVPRPGPGLLSWSSSRTFLRPRQEDDGRVDVSDRPMAKKSRWGQKPSIKIRVNQTSPLWLESKTICINMHQDWSSNCQSSEISLVQTCPVNNNFQT